MRLRSIFGVVLAAVSLASIVQSFREYGLWERGSHQYEELSILERPFRFAGDSFTIADTHPYSPPGEGAYTSEAAVPGTIQILKNQSPLGPPSLAEVRPGRNDLGRYHLWFDAWVFRDRQSGDSALWMARRIEADGSGPRYEVITVTDDGIVTRRLLWTHQLGRSYPVFRSTQFLRGSSFFVVPLSALDFFIFPLFLFIFPIGTLIIGLLLSRGGKRRHSARAGEPVIGADTGSD
jgi:hypothetical protein